MRVGFIGLGTMGAPMASNLLSAGHELTVYNRTPSKAEPLAAAGARVAGSVSELAGAGEVVITIISDTPDVREVVLGEGGVLESIAPGSVIVDMSTVRPELAIEVEAAAAERGVAALDAPVSGGENGARAGTLTIMAGGEQEAFDRCAPVFDAIGSAAVRVGPAGAGQTVKAANQLIVAGNLEVLAEAILFLEASGVDPELAVSAMSGGMAGSRIMRDKAPGMIERSFVPGFRADLHHKDLGILRDALERVGSPSPAAELAAERMRATVEEGDGALDHSGLIRSLERSRELRPPAR